MRIKKPFRGIVYTVTLDSSTSAVAISIAEPLTDEVRWWGEEGRKEREKRNDPIPTKQKQTGCRAISPVSAVRRKYD